ncbi:MAG: hypothetical protein GDA40_10530 [Rhodobacteraceae bacterium]|nr:hypothetical protein [Paracoccaceae bacterium]
MDTQDLDPKRLIREAYRIEGIDAAQCRSIFLDWALGVPPEGDTQRRIALLLQHYAPQHPQHPMTLILRQGLGGIQPARRRGGRRRGR